MDMERPRAFISFRMEDRWARDFLKERARNTQNQVEFIDYSIQDPSDSSWKKQCKRRISETRGTIVLIGATTHQSEPVEWEIKETLEQGHQLFGIQVNDGETHPIPNGLPPESVIRWDFTQISSWLSTWV
ncbi:MULTISPECIES: TIR domain-containing protein [Streptomyces]|uniref:TIR domain-containing protein n=1 Tax=Streptomyces TaxID=1883 RepID=UPI0018FECE3F|nr:MULTISPECIES: TIR domain-containing protein [Streptomyces]